MASAPASIGITPEWKYEDIFSYGKVELYRLNVMVAGKLKCRYGGIGANPVQFPVALSVGGTPAFDPDLASKAIRTYTELLAGAPKEARH